MLKELQEFGLSENEARVYLASLEIGKATAEEISKHAGVKRPTTYVQIESLMQKGLLSSFDEGKKTYFAAESPEHLERIIIAKKTETARKEKELEKLLPDLKKIFEHAGVRPRVRFFEGKEGLLTIREEMLKAKNKEWFIIYSHDALSAVFSDKERDAYSKKRIANNIHSKIIYTNKEGKFTNEDIKLTQKLTERKYFPQEKLNLSSDMIIFDNKVVLMALKEKLFGVIIESDEITKSMKSVFAVVWEVGEK
ncbi:MAG: hypothetical protein HYT93_02530 [Parcubacteria group bacterium]|nr:hypothetical protein [Parcubacteria group bacterium]